jgi:hypothetical protein
MSNTKGTAWEWDLRVRDRNLKAGVIDKEQLGKHLAALPDLEPQVESFMTEQPMFEGDDSYDDEDEDEDEVAS